MSRQDLTGQSFQTKSGRIALPYCRLMMSPLISNSPQMSTPPMALHSVALLVFSLPRF
jgi:hypothetical protein